MKKGIFITGTDTGVGKTIVTAGLASVIRSRGINTGVMKPVSAGALPCGSSHVSEDALFLGMAASSPEEEMGLINPVRLEMPLSPLAASRLEKRDIDLDDIRAAYRELCRRHDFLLVEGIGGILVPVKEKYFVIDMIKEMELPLVIVARPDIGTINHTLLTVNEARGRGIELTGIIFNSATDNPPGIAEQTNPDIIRELSGAPVLGSIPYDPDIDVRGLRAGSLAGMVSGHVDIDAILA